MFYSTPVADHETIRSNIIVDPELTSKRKRDELIQIDEHKRAPVWLYYEFWLLKGEDGKPDTKYAFCKYYREHKYKASSGYEDEILKATLCSKLDSIDSRTCFTCDCKSSITKYGYLTQTAHYVDNEWVLRSHITTLFSGSDNPTTNLYLLLVVAIEKWLVLTQNHNVLSIQLMCQSMMEKYEKYWSDLAIILSVAVMLDPRFKLKFVKGLYSMLYVPPEVNVKVRDVYDAMVELDDFYRSSSSSQMIPLPSQSHSNPSHASSSYSSQQFSATNFMNDFFSFNSSCGERASKHDDYLNTPLTLNYHGFDSLVEWLRIFWPFLSLQLHLSPLLALGGGGGVGFWINFEFLFFPKMLRHLLLHKIGCLGICKRRSWRIVLMKLMLKKMKLLLIASLRSLAGGVMNNYESDSLTFLETMRSMMISFKANND
ncbi:Zinc finger BED domain-containing protein RICESLEEPER 2 [Bienertia sinuspersici]